MSENMTVEFREAREICDRAMKLPPSVREEIAIEIYESLNPQPGRPYSDREYWKAEIALRIEAIQNGTMKTYSLDETMEELEQTANEGLES